LGPAAGHPAENRGFRFPLYHLFRALGTRFGVNLAVACEGASAGSYILNFNTGYG
jgi:hypothetical protein